MTFRQRTVGGLLALALVSLACNAGPAPGSPSSPDAPIVTASVSPAQPTRPPTVRPTFPDDDFSRLVDQITGRGGAEGELDRLWRRVLAAEDVAYERPSDVVAYRGGEEVPPSGCSPGTGIGFWRQNARYCPADGSILYDELWLRDFAETAGPFAPVAILAHEWGHHVQHLLATRGFSIQLELQADCFAGMFLGTSEQVVEGEYVIREQELDSGLRTFFSIGNRDYSEDSWFQAYEHGSQNQRLVAFGTGYLGALGDLGEHRDLVDGYPWCAGYADFEAGELTEIGPFTLLNPPGRAEEWRDDTYHIEPAVHTRQQTSGIRLTWLESAPLDGPASALEHLQAAVAERMPGATLLYEPTPMDTARVAAAAHYFERPVPAGGEAGLESGMVYLQLPPETDGALLLVVHRPQPALRDPLTREKLAVIAEHLVSMSQTINRLCAPYDRADSGAGSGNVACLAEQ